MKIFQDGIMIPAWFSSTLRFHFRNGLKVDSYLKCSINLACNVEIIAYQTFRWTLWMKPYFFRNMSFYVTNRMSRFCLALKVYFLNKLLFPWEQKTLNFHPETDLYFESCWFYSLILVNGENWKPSVKHSSGAI